MNKKNRIQMWWYTFWPNSIPSPNINQQRFQADDKKCIQVTIFWFMASKNNKPIRNIIFNWNQNDHSLFISVHRYLFCFEPFVCSVCFSHNWEYLEAMEHTLNRTACSKNEHQKFIDTLSWIHYFVFDASAKRMLSGQIIFVFVCVQMLM